MTEISRLMFLIGVSVSLGACSNEQVPPRSGAIYAPDPAIVRKVQIALRDRGCYHGLEDGFLGEATGNAIQLYQIDHSIRVIPLLDPSLLISLGIAR